MRLIKTYGHEGMRDTFSLVCAQNDRDSADYTWELQLWVKRQKQQNIGKRLQDKMQYI